MRQHERLPGWLAARAHRLARYSRSHLGYTLLVAAAGLLAAIWGYWMAHEVLRGIGTYDFSTYYAAARALRLDPHSDIYAQAVLDASAAAAHVTHQPPLPYTYPPLPAILLAPLTLLPFPAAVHAWEAINLALWLATAALLAMEMRAVLGPRLLVPVALAVLVCLSWAPAADTLAFGQINFLVLLPLALVPGLLRHGRDGLAGAALGFAAMIKLTPIVLLLYLVLTGRWRALLAALGMLAALAVLTASVVGPHVVLAALPQAMRVSAYDTSLGQNEALLGAVTLALLAAAPHAAGLIRALEYTLLAALAITVGSLLWLRLPHRRDMHHGFTETDALGYAAALCALVLVSPLAWLHHYLWVLPAAALVLAVSIHAWLEARTDAKRRMGRRLALAIIGIVLTGLVLPIGWDHTPWLATPHLLGIPLGNWLREIRPIGTLLVLGVALSGLERSGARAERLGARLARLPRIPYTVGGGRGRGKNGRKSLIWQRARQAPPLQKP